MAGAVRIEEAEAAEAEETTEASQGVAAIPAAAEPAGIGETVDCVLSMRVNIEAARKESLTYKIAKITNQQKNKLRC